MSSAENTIKATLLTFVVSALCFLPPILHFITGPLGPGIGGYVAGSRFHLSAAQAAILGLIVGLTDGYLGPQLILSFNHLHFSGMITAIVIGFAMIYTGVLSGVTAWLGGSTVPEKPTA